MIGAGQREEALIRSAEPFNGIRRGVDRNFLLPFRLSVCGIAN